MRYKPYSRDRIKNVLQYLSQPIISKSLPPIVVASMGRSGSTLVCDAARRAFAQARFPDFLQTQGRRLVSGQAWDMKHTSFARGAVYKTHGLAHELPDNSGAKVVFLFGSATDAALSVLACHDRYGSDWTKLHFEHLRAVGDFEDLGTRDVLRFGEQLDGWIRKTGTPRLILHYDFLWDHEDTLSEFIEAPVRLPERLPRSGALAADPALREQFSQTYAELDKRIAELPVCQVLQ